MRIKGIQRKSKNKKKGNKKEGYAGGVMIDFAGNTW